MSNLSDFFGGGSGGSAEPGDTIQSFASDADMAARLYLPARGGVLTQASQPKLFEGIRHSNYALTGIYPSGVWTFTDSNYSGNPLHDWNGGDYIGVAAQYGATCYSHILRISTGTKISQQWLGSQPQSCCKYLPSIDEFWMGSNDGYVNRYYWNGSSYVVQTISYTNLPHSASNKEIFDVMESGGYVYIATRGRIFRAVTGSDYSVIGSWAVVQDAAKAAVSVGAGKTRSANFFDDTANSGYLFFNQWNDSNVYRSTDGGASFVSVSCGGNNKSKIFRWGSDLYMIPYNSGYRADIPTAFQTYVFKSTNNGDSWALSPMLLYATSEFMQPFVKEDLLHYVYRSDASTWNFMTCREALAGLQDEVDGIDLTKNLTKLLAWARPNSFLYATGLQSTDAFGATLIQGYFQGAINTYSCKAMITPTYELATQFALPSLETDVPTFVKGE